MSEYIDTSEGGVEISLQSIGGESKTESSTALRLASIPPKYQFSPNLAHIQLWQGHVSSMLKNCPHTHKEKHC